jgi:L-alanine-DL-glutamate epimerase-like enolase superfamily enzyme
MENHPNTITKKKGLTLRFKPYELQLKHRFTLSGSSRKTTPVMLTELEYDGIIGYGEAAMPPYMGESHQTVAVFLSRLKLNQFRDPFQLEKILNYVDQSAPGNCAAKASVDIALHDLIGKLLGKPLHQIWGYDASQTPFTSFTIGIDSPEVIREKVCEASPYKILKVKLGRSNDLDIIKTIRSETNVPLSVDVNQGWTDKNEALDKIFWLQQQGVVFIEQPMPKEVLDDMAWLTENSPLPTFADESVQRMTDVKKLQGVFTGINIKLMKCTGLHEAKKMFDLAHQLGMKVLVGCNTETSCAISAAAQLSPQADWADLDGNLLITNDPFQGVDVVEGKIALNNQPGIGVELK